MKALSKKVVLKRDPEHGWPTDWKWACSVCGREYERQSEAELCCLEKKDDTGRPWLKDFKMCLSPGIKKRRG
jgi:hypothetical protein